VTTQTHEQDVIAAQAKLKDLKSELKAALKHYSGREQTLDAVLDCQRCGNAYFNSAEEFVGNSDLLGAHKSAVWVQGFAETCAEILKSMPDYFAFLSEAFSGLNSGVENSKLLPGSTAYANMQRMVKKFLSPEESRDLERLFKTAKLPTYGFRYEVSEFMSKKFQAILSFCFGAAFVSLMLVIALYLPNPSLFQIFVFRVVLALAGAGVVAAFPGFIEVKFGNWLRAGGALAVFAILYLLNPAQLATKVPSPNPQPSTMSQSINQSGSDNQGVNQSGSNNTVVIGNKAQR
jgi:hypothetical protein